MLQYNFLLYILFTTILSPIRIFWTKKTLKYITIQDYIILQFIVGIFMSITLLLLLKKNIKTSHVINTIYNNKWIIVLMILSSLITIISRFSKYTIIKKELLTKIKPILVGSSIIMTFLYAYFIFNKKIKLNSIVGSIIILIGIYIVYL